MDKFIDICYNILNFTARYIHAAHDIMIPLASTTAQR